MDVPWSVAGHLSHLQQMSYFSTYPAAAGAGARPIRKFKSGLPIAKNKTATGRPRKIFTRLKPAPIGLS